MALYNLSNDFDYKRLLARLESAHNKGEIVEFRKPSPKRTISQNKYLHLLLGWFAVETGYSAEYVKQRIFKQLCNSHIFEYEVVNAFTSEPTKELRSTSDLTTSEMSIAIDRFRNWSASEGGIYLPEANEHLFLQQIELEIQRHERYI